MPAPSTAALLLVDVVNERDQPVATIHRADVIASGANFRTCHVFVFAASGALLLQRLAESRERHANRWGSSVAAYLHAGESYQHAAIRRLAEELGLINLAVQFSGKISMSDQRSRKFVSLYVARADTAAINEPDHIAELAYWPLARLDGAVVENPDLFTPTFVELYAFFRGQSGGD